MTTYARQVERLRERAEPFLVQCGACDAGLPMGCACTDADPRPLIADLLATAEAHAALVKAVEGLLSEWEVDGLGTDRFCAAELRQTILAATDDTAADRGGDDGE